VRAGRTALLGGLLLLSLLACAALGAAQAGAVISAPTTIDGPNTEALSLGGVAMAPDGTGGVVYTKTVAGMQHVFVSRYDGSNWSPPIRVDWENEFAASQPRIAAGRGGRLMVVWVAPVATIIGGEVRDALWSASLGPGSHEFSPSLPVDLNVGTGAGVEPSLAGVSPGKAIVAYRVVTYSFQQGVNEIPPAPQLHPGDVLAQIRAARLEGERWSHLPILNRNPTASLRPPGEANGPRVAIDDNGRAVVAWQEPELNGVARVLMRRISGTTPGPVQLAGPTTWEGKPVSDEATALAVAVTGFDQARVAVRVDGSPSSPLGGPRVFLTTLGSVNSTGTGQPVGPEPADGGAPLPGPLGAPTVAANDGAAGGNGLMDLAFAAGGAVRQVGIDPQGKPGNPEVVQGPPAEPGTPVVDAIGPEGQRMVAYEAVGEGGSPGVAVRQEFVEGGAQAAVLYGPVGGEISQLQGSESGSGEALVAFRQGEGGNFAIVVDAVRSAAERFSLVMPKHWVRPEQAIVRWPAPLGGAGNARYEVLLNGREIGSGITERQFRLTPSRLLGGTEQVQVIATDGLGEEVLSRTARLRVDGQPPRLTVAVRRHFHAVVLKLKDAQSGVLGRATRVSFGDGKTVRGGTRLVHHYSRPGLYTIDVRARDRVHNVLVQRLRLRVP
jgi:hypothetical protein